jgi:hypothetical protein
MDTYPAAFWSSDPSYYSSEEEEEEETRYIYGLAINRIARFRAAYTFLSFFYFYPSLCVNKS